MSVNNVLNTREYELQWKSYFKSINFKNPTKKDEKIHRAKIARYIAKIIKEKKENGLTEDTTMKQLGVPTVKKHISNHPRRSSKQKRISQRNSILHDLRECYSNYEYYCDDKESNGSDMVSPRDEEDEEDRDYCLMLLLQNERDTCEYGSDMVSPRDEEDEEDEKDRAYCLMLLLQNERDTCE